MEGQVCATVLTVLTVLCLTGLTSAQITVKDTYVLAGETLDLTPPFSGTITNILWKLVRKQKNSLVVEWVNSEVEYYGRFRDRARLNTSTGQLLIGNMSEDYVGLYKVELNSQDQDQQYGVTLIQKVPKPEVVLRPLVCSSSLENCSLSCEGDTTGAGPVTYSWKEDNGEWKEGTKDKAISKQETSAVKTFSCRLKNPGSEEESKPLSNPFYKSIVWVIVVIALIALVVVGGIMYWKRDSIKSVLPFGSSRSVSLRENGRPADGASPGPAELPESVPLRAEPNAPEA